MKLLIILTLVFGVQAHAVSDHLEPEAGPFGESASEGYDRFLRQTLLKDTSRQVQMVTLKSFKVEEALYIQKEENSNPRVILNQVSGRSIWGSLQSQLEVKTKGDPIIRIERSEAAEAKAISKIKVKVTENSAPITSPTLELLEQVWLEALFQVKYPPPSNTMIFDGVTYHFASWKWGVGTMEGQIHNPQPGTKMGDLVEIGESLRAFVTSPEKDRPAIEKAIKDKAEKLLKRFKKP